MLVKYGKAVDMRDINRNIENIGGIVEKTRLQIKKNYQEAGGGKTKVQDMWKPAKYSICEAFGKI